MPSRERRVFPPRRAGSATEHMPRLQRITTEYVEAEDRIRIAGKAGAEEDTTLVLWLTRRLLERLLPPLFEWLEGGAVAPARTSPGAGRAPLGGVVAREVAQDLAQLRALRAHEPQTPVRPAPECPGWLATSIDLMRGEAGASLTFKGGDHGAARMMLTPTEARQWLAILYVCYRKAGWPLERWPEWIAENVAPQRPPAAILH